MPSLFPGLDPYLETHWGDVHTSLMVYVADTIQEQLPDDLYARVEEGGEFFANTDVLADEPITRQHIEIRDRSSGGQVVTAIEILRPTDKMPGGGREQYKGKQREYIDDGVNLVEIDLVRSGQHTISPAEHSIPKDRRNGLYACVCRADGLERAHVYDIALNHPLPIIATPLRPTDADIRLDLQALLTQAYDRGRYAATIDYSRDPDPPLSPNAAEWADGLLRAAGKRK